MSASLVGSEMCIRDRCKVLKVQSAIRPMLVSAAVRLNPPNARRYCNASVSYTHLTLPTICSV
eukprot:15045012-Alexandrium_andersonii.AAC.1